MKLSIFALAAVSFLASCYGPEPRRQTNYLGNYQPPHASSSGYEHLGTREQQQPRYRPAGYSGRPYNGSAYNAGHNTKQHPWWAPMLLEANDFDLEMARRRAALGDKEAQDFVRRNEASHNYIKEHWND